MNGATQLRPRSSASLLRAGRPIALLYDRAFNTVTSPSTRDTCVDDPLSMDGESPFVRMRYPRVLALPANTL